MTDVGRVADATGLSQAEPREVSALSGFDPSRIDVTVAEWAVLTGAARLLWKATQRSQRCETTECADFNSPNCVCRVAYRFLAASAIEAPWAETVGLGAKHESAVPNGQTPIPDVGGSNGE